MSKKTSPIEKMGKTERKKKLQKIKPKKSHYKKGPRKKDWLDEDWDEMGQVEDERVFPHGENERRYIRDQQITQPQTNLQESVQPSPDKIQDGNYFEGVVIVVFTQNCDVQIGDEVWSCALRGELREPTSAFSNRIAVGDRVQVSSLEAGEGVVEEVLPRRNVLARQNVKNPALRQAVAANIDRVLIVQAWRQPNFWPELVDRYLITAQMNSLDAIICINKIDLVEDRSEFDQTVKPYRDLGLEIFETSATTGKGIKTLAKLLMDGTTVLAGLSGVGKSSLISVVRPDLELDALTVGMRGKNKNQGRHTTSASTLYQLGQDGYVIDTPGIRSFGLAGMSKRELASCYPEMAKLIGDCQYDNCGHIHEPGCAVREGVEAGTIAKSRYKSYVKLYGGLGD